MISWYVLASKKLWRTQISLVCKHHWAAEWNIYFPFLCFYLKGEGAILDWHGAWVSTPQVWCSSLHRRGLCFQQAPSQSYSLGMDSSHPCSQLLAKLFVLGCLRNCIFKRNSESTFLLKSLYCLQEKVFHSRINVVLVYKLWTKSAPMMLAETCSGVTE